LRVDGRDLHLDLPVSPSEAALGATVPVRTLTGTARLRVPAGSSTGRRLRLRGQGMPGPGGEHGDLYARVQIVVPKHLDERERELYEQLAAVSRFDPREARR
jgi:curved DNA-binding protein